MCNFFVFTHLGRSFKGRLLRTVVSTFIVVKEHYVIYRTLNFKRHIIRYRKMKSTKGRKSIVFTITGGDRFFVKGTRFFRWNVRNFTFVSTFFNSLGFPLVEGSRLMVIVRTWIERKLHRDLRGVKILTSQGFITKD